MQGSLDNPPIIIRSARWKAALLLISTLALFGLAVHAVRAGYAESKLGAIFGLAIFGFGLAVAILAFLFPSHLEISPSGIAQKTAFSRKTLIQWGDVREFRVVSVAGTKSVGFDYADGYAGRAGMRGLSRSLAGVEGALAGGWTLEPEALAHLLNEARRRWWAPPQPLLVD